MHGAVGRVVRAGPRSERCSHLSTVPAVGRLQVVEEAAAARHDQVAGRQLEIVAGMQAPEHAQVGLLHQLLGPGAVTASKARDA